MKHLEDYLALHAQETPEKTAVVCGQEECSYGELYLRVCRRAEELALSLSTPDSSLFTLHSSLPAIPFRSTQSIGFLVEYMAIHKPVRQRLPWSMTFPKTVSTR